jgi:hypothetical protein
MRVDASGNVNIGSTVNYGGLLSINRAKTDGVATYLTFRDGSTGGTTNFTTYADPAAGTSDRWDYQGVYLALRAGTTERLRLDGSGNLQFNSGYGSVAIAYGVRTWVNFNGTGTPAIRASGNVSSITDVGTGKYRVNFTTAMPDANYSLSCGGVRGTSGTGSTFSGLSETAYTSVATTSFVQVMHRDSGGSGIDPESYSVTIFR